MRKWIFQKKILSIDNLFELSEIGNEQPECENDTDVNMSNVNTLGVEPSLLELSGTTLLDEEHSVEYLDHDLLISYVFHYVLK